MHAGVGVETNPLHNHYLFLKHSSLAPFWPGHNVFVTKSTIHRWSEEESDFPLIAGVDGRTRLYSQQEFVVFIMRRLRKFRRKKGEWSLKSYQVYLDEGVRLDVGRKAAKLLSQDRSKDLN